ncbi:MAG: hypothetical protein JWQ66_683 [Mucilaginibacter sp.]|nr:hypothetical protein [Mucilaginibacter sp.]
MSWFEHYWLIRIHYRPFQTVLIGLDYCLHFKQIYCSKEIR